jgi:hypothetical protein
MALADLDKNQQLRVLLSSPTLLSQERRELWVYLEKSVNAFRTPKIE